MDYRNIPSIYQPAYCWLWNTTATKELIEKEIDEMYDSGIRAFYVLGEPENFRPNFRRTHLKPEYLTDEYLDLVYHAYEYGKSKGMNSWLYNEGGFPSGFAAGLIRKIDPSLYTRNLGTRSVKLEKDSAYTAADGTLAAYVDGKRIKDGESYDRDVEVVEYIEVDGDAPRCTRTDNAQLKNTELFIQLTHEAYKKRFGDAIGSDVTLMFDDEASMGQWTPDLDVMFRERFGYDLLDYLPYVSRRAEPKTDEQYRAVSDYIMLCGDLTRENYFVPMKEWCEKNGMKSTGHLNIDNQTRGNQACRYGNMMQMLRAFNVPGIDVIWSQITYPDTDGKCCKDPNYSGDNINFEFFPRLASSAANQQGHSEAVSETFAVYGAHVVPEEMRFAVNFQAVRGISLFNFMVISLDRSTAMCLQYRPNFNVTSPGMDMLGQINDHTARLSAILQNTRPILNTALYFPLRTIGACGMKGKRAEKSFADLGHLLEDAGVSFDIIDEEIAEKGIVENGTLIYNGIRYENVFIPNGTYFEDDALIAKLETCGKRIEPDIGRSRREIQSRRLAYDNGDEGLFVMSSAGETVSDRLTIDCAKTPYVIDLESGDICDIEYTRRGGKVIIDVTLMRGEGLMLLFTDAKVDAKPIVSECARVEVTLDRAYISRRYSLDAAKGPQNEYFDFENAPKLEGLGEWDIHFSGEATYEARLPKLPCGMLTLDLGEVRHFAKVYINGEKVGEVTMPPYRLSIENVKEGDELKIVTANTIANVTHDAPFFDEVEKCYVGTYHANMKKKEALAQAGGLIGPIFVTASREG